MLPDAKKIQTAETILAHLGGSYFITTAGITNLFNDDGELILHLPRNSSHANRLRIALIRGSYHMTFLSTTGNPIVSQYKFLKADQLAKVFRSVTNLPIS
jgi:hypothetical protein